MISRINLLKRKEGLSAEEFSAYLTQAHAGLLATMPYLKGCETNVVVDNEQRSPFDRGSTEIDGYTEMFFDSYGDMQQAMDEVKMVVEGVYSAKAAIALAKKYGVDMPIIEEVNKVLFEDKPAKEAVNDLMLRDKKMEHGNLGWED